MSILSIYGAEGTGKTTLGLTSPKPIDDYDLELGLDRAIGRFKAEEIHRLCFTSAVGDFAIPQKRKGTKSIPQGYVKQRDDLIKAVNTSCKSNNLTVMLDTISVCWEIIWKAYQEENEIESMYPPVLYSVPNGIMTNLIQHIKLHNKNLILIHHERDIYVNDKATGEKEPDGFKHTADLVTIQVRLVKETIPQMSQSGTKPLPPKILPVAYIMKPNIGMTETQRRIVEPTWDSILKRVAEVR